jgi:hypothetical protein
LQVADASDLGASGGCFGESGDGEREGFGCDSVVVGWSAARALAVRIQAPHQALQQGRFPEKQQTAVTEAQATLKPHSLLLCSTINSALSSNYGVLVPAFDHHREGQKG